MYSAQGGPFWRGRYGASEKSDSKGYGGLYPVFPQKPIGDNNPAGGLALKTLLNVYLVYFTFFLASHIPKPRAVITNVCTQEKELKLCPNLVVALAM